GFGACPVLGGHCFRCSLFEGNEWRCGDLPAPASWTGDRATRFERLAVSDQHRRLTGDPSIEQSEERGDGSGGRDRLGHQRLMSVVSSTVTAGPGCAKIAATPQLAFSRPDG